MLEVARLADLCEALNSGWKVSSDYLSTESDLQQKTYEQKEIRLFCEIARLAHSTYLFIDKVEHILG